MVKHIVLFKLKDDASADAKLAAMHAFKDAIAALPAKIPFIRKIEVGLQIRPRRGASPSRVNSTRWTTSDSMPYIPITWPPESCWPR